jgi:hypothetical protein
LVWYGCVGIDCIVVSASASRMRAVARQQDAGGYRTQEEAHHFFAEQTNEFLVSLRISFLLIVYSVRRREILLSSTEISIAKGLRNLAKGSGPLMIYRRTR